MGLSSQLKQSGDGEKSSDPKDDVAESLDVVQERANQLRAIFPDVFSEGKVDFERLKAALGDDLARTSECYELSWAGKGDARREIQKRTTATLRPDTANSVNWDATRNLYIEGENLEVLRTLQKAYFGKVKMIYIDPPYNTGSDSFVYPDDYSETLKEYQARTGESDEAGFLNKQTLWKKNSKENGQFHSAWLSMMYPRLFLARNLLREDGVIFVSIDDNEAANLKLLLDEIFGEENFMSNIVWQKKYAATNDAKGFSNLHDHILVYQKSAKFQRKLLPRTAEMNRPYKNDDGDGRGLWRSDNLLVKSFSSSGVYPIINPNTKKDYFPPAGSSWRASQETMRAWLAENRIYFGKDGRGAPQLKRFLNEVQDGSVPTTWWKFEDVGHNDAANKELASLFEAKTPFDTPKPSTLIKQMLRIASDEDSLILDFFSGSGTTAQAVLDLNEEDGGNRQFICVQMPELLEEGSEAYKAGYRTIADIGRARIKKVIERIEDKRLESSKQATFPDADTKPKQTLGFNAFKLAPSNFKEWRTDINNQEELLAQLEYHVDSTKPDSEAKCMVYELLLKMALPITTPLQCHEINNGASLDRIYMATPENAKSIAIFFDHATEAITQFILRESPAKVICLNKSFKDSQALTNFNLQLQDANIALEIV